MTDTLRSEVNDPSMAEDQPLDADHIRRTKFKDGEWTHEAFRVVTTAQGEQARSAHADKHSIAIAGDVHGDVTQVENLSIIQYANDSIRPAQAKARQKRSRQKLLRQVDHDWIKGVFERSLHKQILMALEMTESPDNLDFPWELVVEQPQPPSQELRIQAQLIVQFDQYQSLLILGEPGSGKTTMLLDLTRQLIQRAAVDQEALLPVVLNLSSWSINQSLLADWLVAEIHQKYAIPKKVARDWIEQDNLILLLDGLDEVSSDCRLACLNAINNFTKEYLGPLVVCCRLSDYRALPAKLQLQQSVIVRPLSLAAIEAYLAKVLLKGSELHEAIIKNSTLQQLARTPLMLSIMVFVFQDGSTAELQSVGDNPDYEAIIYEAYIQKMFTRRGRDDRYSSEQAKIWLHWLAKQMNNHGQSSFYIENLQVSWLPTRGRQWLYNIGTRLIGALLLFIVYIASTYLTWIWVFSMLSINWSEFPTYRIFLFNTIATFAFILSSVVAIKRILVWPVVLLSAGITALFVAQAPGEGFLGGAIFALPAAIIGQLLAERQRIHMVGRLRLSWPKAAIGLIAGVFLGLVVGLSSRASPWLNGLQAGLLAAILLAVILGVEYQLTTSKPVETLRRNLQNAGRIGLGIFLLLLVSLSLIGLMLDEFVVSLGFGFLAGTLVGLATALYFGGSTGLQHGSLRVLLTQAGKLPWRVANFLDYAVDHIFLYKVGAGYYFIHGSLRDYFAGLYQEVNGVERKH